MNGSSDLTDDQWRRHVEDALAPHPVDWPDKAFDPPEARFHLIDPGPISPHYEKDPPMPRYLSDTDRRNLHLLVHNERLVELRRYAKALLAVIDQRRTMDPDRRPVADALPGFKMGRDVPNIHIVEITPSVLTQLRGYIEVLRTQHGLDNVDDPYETAYTSDDDLSALYYLVELLDNILPKPDAEPIVTTGGFTAPRGGIKMFAPETVGIKIDTSETDDD